MSYGFDMGFAQANSLQEAMAIALEYTQSQMTEKNVKKSIRDNLYAASQQNQSPKTMPILRCLSRKSSTQRPLVPPAKRLFAESPCYRRRRPNCSVGYAIR